MAAYIQIQARPQDDQSVDLGAQRAQHRRITGVLIRLHVALNHLHVRQGAAGSEHTIQSRYYCLCLIVRLVSRLWYAPS